MTFTSFGDPDLVPAELPDSHFDRIDLVAVPSTVRHARRWAGWLLAGYEPPLRQDLIDTAVLLVSELVTNAVRAAGRVASLVSSPDVAQIALLITCESATLRIEVHDPVCGQVPLVCDGSSDAETGRGLMVIEALSQHWGWRPGRCGKVVWCELQT